MESDKKMTMKKNFRLFSDEFRRISLIVDLARDEKDLRIYENDSHFIRCAIIRLLNDEEKKYN